MMKEQGESQTNKGKRDLEECQGGKDAGEEFPFQPMANATSSAMGAKSKEQRLRIIVYGTIGLVVVVLLIALASVCGTGRCESKQESSSTSSSSTSKATDENSVTTAAPTISSSPTSTPSPTQFFKNDHCNRAIGPFRIGGLAAIGRLDLVVANTTHSNEDRPPICHTSTELPVDTFATTNGLWYMVTGGGDVIRVSTCATQDLVATVNENDGDLDTNEVFMAATTTRLSVYGQTPVAKGISSTTRDDTTFICENLICVAANDHFCNNHASVSWKAEKGVNYYVLVEGTPGAFAINMEEEQNGECETSIGPLDTSSIVIGSMRNAGEELIFTCDLDEARAGQKWYSVLGTGSWMKASTCHPETDFAARVEVTTDECFIGGCASIRDSDCGINTGNQMVWYSEQGTTYNILIYKTNFRPGTTFALSLSSFQPVSNDECFTPTPIETNGIPVYGSTLMASVDADQYKETGAPACGVVEILHPGVWYTVQGTGDVLLASTCDNNNNRTDFATELSIYTGSSCDLLECIITGIQFCNEKASVYWDSILGEKYYILVHGSPRGLFPSVGNFVLSVSPLLTETNNLCQNAIVMDPNSMLTGSNFAATLDTDLPVCTSFTSTAPGIWYSVMGTGSFLRASTCHPATDFDTQITIYRGSCDSLICVSSDDNSCGLQSSVSWSTTQGTTYYILVHGRLYTAVGRFTLSVEEYEPLLINDFCTAGTFLVPDGSIQYSSTMGATFDNAPTCMGVPGAAPGVWYTMEGTGTILAASLCNEATNYDSALTVFEGNDCTELQCIASNVVGPETDCAQLSWVSRRNHTYHLLVHGWDTRVGDFGLVMDEPEPDVSNDFCLDAIALPPRPGTIYGSTVNATADVTPICSNLSQYGPGVWYTVVGTSSRLLASTCNTDGSFVSNFDTKISIFTGLCGGLTCVLADDNYCGRQSRLVWESNLGVTYYILIHGEEAGNFGLVVDKFVPETANDFCSSAQGPLIPTGDTIYYGSTTGSSFDNVALCGVTNTSPGVWFFVVGTGERLYADTCNEKTDFDTKLSVFAGRDCSVLECITGNDDGCGLQSSVQWDSTIGEFYWILLHGFDTYGVGNYAFQVSGSALFN